MRPVREPVCYACGGVALGASSSDEEKRLTPGECSIPVTWYLLEVGEGQVDPVKVFGQLLRARPYYGLLCSPNLDAVLRQSVPTNVHEKSSRPLSIRDRCIRIVSPDDHIGESKSFNVCDVLVAEARLVIQIIASDFESWAWDCDFSMETIRAVDLRRLKTYHMRTAC